MSNRGYWVTKDGLKRWVDPPWITDPKLHEKMKALKKGPANWYLTNKWKICVERTGPDTFIVGEGTNPVAFPSYTKTEEIQKVFDIDKIVGKASAMQRIYRRGEGLISDPLEGPSSRRTTLSANWVDKNDLRLFHRCVEIMAMVTVNRKSSNRLSRKHLALIYNTTVSNIDRIFAMWASGGVKFTLHQGRVRIVNYGVFNKEAITEIYRNSNGLEDIVEASRLVLEDVSDKRTGKLQRSKVRLKLKALWEAKLKRDEECRQSELI